MLLLLEDINLQQLQRAPISPSIKAFAAERLTVQGPVSQNTKLLSIMYNAQTDIMIFKFKAKATVNKYPDTQTYADVNPVSRPPFAMEGNPDRAYDVWLGFYPFQKTLAPLIKTEADLTEQNVKVAFNKCMIKLWSNSPSFHYQGFNYNLSKQGAALFPTSQAPQRWDKIHGNSLLDKHTLQVVTTLPFYMSQMARAVIQKVKQGNTNG